MSANSQSAGTPPVATAVSAGSNAPLDGFAVDVKGVRHRYGKKTVLDALDLRVPTGAVYGLFGANGAGKSTLLRLLAGIDPVQHGRVTVLGADVGTAGSYLRQQIGYVAEGQQLPAWMRLSQLLTYCAPLYPAWDHDLAAALQMQFMLDPEEKIGAMSRGQRMKVALLCALSPRPRALFMDEPFTGLDVTVKDELVRGLLNSTLTDTTTMVIATHDIVEVETLVEHVAFLRHGRIGVAGDLDGMRERYRYVELTFGSVEDMPSVWPAACTAIAPVERSGLRAAMYVDLSRSRDDVNTLAALAVHTTQRGPTLKELYTLFAAPTNSMAGGNL